MDHLDHTQSTAVPLICQVCGRRMLYIPSNDADQETAAFPISCRSCGSTVTVPVALNSGGTPGQILDEAATARIQPQVLPAGDPVSALPEASTAILAPPAQSRSDGAPLVNSPSPVEAPLREFDRYQTAAAVDPVTPPSPPATSPLLPETAPEAKESPSGRRNLWLAIGTSLVLVILFVGGILLAQTGSQSKEPEVTPAIQPTSSATASLPVGFVQKTDADGLYSFAVPSTWVPKPHQGAANVEFTIYTDPPYDTTFEVESFPSGTQAGGASLDTQVLLQAFPTLNSRSLSQPNSVELDGETWITETAKLTVTQNGGSFTQNLAVQTADYNGTTFIIFFSSPDTPAASADGKALLQVVSTFTFLG
jgi:hypothetical protein